MSFWSESWCAWNSALNEALSIFQLVANFDICVVFSHVYCRWHQRDAVIWGYHLCRLRISDICFHGWVSETGCPLLRVMLCEATALKSNIFYLKKCLALNIEPGTRCLRLWLWKCFKLVPAFRHSFHVFQVNFYNWLMYICSSSCVSHEVGS